MERLTRPDMIKAVHLINELVDSVKALEVEVAELKKPAAKAKPVKTTKK